MGEGSLSPVPSGPCHKSAAVQAECLLSGVTWAAQSALRLRGKRLRPRVSGSGSGLREAAVSGQSQAVRGREAHISDQAQPSEEINTGKIRNRQSSVTEFCLCKKTNDFKCKLPESYMSSSFQIEN